MSNAVACLLVLGMALLGSSGQAQVWEKKALCLDAARKMVRAIEAEESATTGGRGAVVRLA